jgi:SAM-dependent methyltransferase
MNWEEKQYHLDLGSGKIRRGKITLDRHGDVDILCDLEKDDLPFPDNSIESIISFHALEHLTPVAFMKTMDECYRVLQPKGYFYIRVPLFPSVSAVSDPDHKKFFMKDTFNSFCDWHPDKGFWSDDFAEPYTKCRFKMIDKDYDSADATKDVWEQDRELRVVLQK